MTEPIVLVDGGRIDTVDPARTRRSRHATAPDRHGRDLLPGPIDAHDLRARAAREPRWTDLGDVADLEHDLERPSPRRSRRTGTGHRGRCTTHRRHRTGLRGLDDA